MRRQAGAGAIFIFAMLLVLLVALAAIYMLSRTNSNIDQQKQTQANLATAAAALEQYVGSTGRLPCPADPTASPETGTESVAGGTACTSSLSGTIPWRTIGLRRDDSFDAWGWRISYRVYSASPGGFTYPYPPDASTPSPSTPTTGGASMVNCDSDTGLLPSAGVDANNLCLGSHKTAAADFLSGKGLKVNVYNDVSGPTISQTYTDVAYVLISHGPTGFGAYTSSGARLDLPNNGPEKDNTSASPSTFFAVAPASDTSVAPNKSGHFDDIVIFRRIGDLAKLTGLTARDWGSSTTLTAATIKSALGLTNPPTSGSLDVNSMSVAGALISSSGGNISFFDDSVANYGIGINGGGSLGITPGEGFIQIKFEKVRDKLGITLNSMGIVSFGFLSWTERAQIQFFKNNSLVATASPLKGCRPDGQFASFTVVPGVSFDQIRLSALSTTPDQFFGTTLDSNFYLSGFATCASTAPSCVTPIEAADPTTHCAWP